MKTLLECSGLRRVRSLIAAGLILAATNVHAVPVDPMSREVCKDVLPQIAKEFAGVLAPIRREGHCLAGDFNGDGKPDVFVVVKVLVGKVPPSARIKTTLPFTFRAAETTEKGRLQFLVLHSTSSSPARDWMHYERLLLDGDSPILVLHYEDMISDMKRIAPDAKEAKELQVPKRAMRGDGVYLMTEAVPAVLYWNGKSYVFHEDPAGP